MDKFLEVAWKQDEIHGEADFDIDRENMVPSSPMLPFPELKPKKERTLNAIWRRAFSRDNFVTRSTS